MSQLNSYSRAAERLSTRVTWHDSDSNSRNDYWSVAARRSCVIFEATTSNPALPADAVRGRTLVNHLSRRMNYR